MNYQRFLDSIKNYFSKEFGEAYQISINEVVKNNGVKLNGLSILKGGEEVSPNIYLNSYYNLYRTGIPMEEIFLKISAAYRQALVNTEMTNIKVELIFSVQCKKIIVRLVNYCKNEEALQYVPYIRFLDLAVTFHCLVNVDESGISSIPVSNKLMDKWNVTIKELMKYGLENSKRLLPMSVKPMEDVIIQLLKEDIKQKCSDTKDIQELSDGITEQISVVCKEMENSKNTSMFVMTNTKGINGASVLLYEENFIDFIEKLPGDVFILPSSIHELIIIPYTSEITIDDLKEMVENVNETQVPSEDYLSDQVYYYSKKSSSFRIVETISEK